MSAANPRDRQLADVTFMSPSVFFNERGGLVVARLGNSIRDGGRLRTGDDGLLYRYVDGVYRADGEAWARAQVRVLLGEKVKRAHFDEVVAWLRSFAPTVTDRQPEGLLNAANGLLDWRTGALHPHDPAVPSTVQLPVPWLPDSECPAIERFLAEVLPDEATVELVIEVVGYVIYAGNPLRRAVLFLGPGCNGKSVLLGVLRTLVGEANIVSIPLQVLSENRFAAAQLFGRLANISGDLDARAIKTTDVFKMVTGGDPIHAEHKYGKQFDFRPFATFVFAANEAPISSDQSSAWFERWVIVPFEHVVPAEKVDPHLLARLTTSDELAGLLVRAVTGLRRLMERGRFDPSAAVQSAGERYRDRLDTVRGFVAEECVIHPESWIPKPVLYRAYKLWCQEGSRFPVSAATFADHLRGGYAMRVDERVRRGTRGWGGIGHVATEET